MSRRRPTPRGMRGYIGEALSAKLGKPDKAGKPYTQTSLGQEMGLTRGQIWHILNPVNLGRSGGVGTRTIDGFLALFDMSMSDFERNVLRWEDEHPEPAAPGESTGEPQPEEPRVEYNERYPNRVIAAEFARRSGISERAIQIVMGRDLGSGDDDINPREWLHWMEDKERELKYEARGGTTRLVEVTEDDIPPPKLPPRKK